MLTAFEAIRKRRSVRSFTDDPVSPQVVDRLLRLALLAPTESMAQAWSFIVVREGSRDLAELVVRGGGEYFRVMRPAAEGVSDDEHAAWARDYAEKVAGGLRGAPMWIVPVLVPRATVPEPHRDALADREHTAQLMSLAFAIENLFVAARAVGLGTLPTNFHGFCEAEFRDLLGLDPSVQAPVITPLGTPTAFPEALPPALAAIRRPWRTLVQDERWGRPRQSVASSPAAASDTGRGAQPAPASAVTPGHQNEVR